MFARIILNKITITATALLLVVSSLLGWANDGGVEDIHTGVTTAVSEQEQVKSILDAIKSPPTLKSREG
ncbi:hypothetical protein ICM05_05310 [Leucobacter sp. cx-42]|uniref:hypothetical protein n=1 Tax=unclassified Leucobacter TaxID=2621730 RepID=UPI00165DDE1F|nr:MULTISPECIES: hypothetical protein [unclassified Leucobacter]MBC9954064.1 hypothetical protein [Leucobacter sp. cx-42]